MRGLIIAPPPTPIICIITMFFSSSYRNCKLWRTCCLSFKWEVIFEKERSKPASQAAGQEVPACQPACQRHTLLIQKDLKSQLCGEMRVFLFPLLLLLLAPPDPLTKIIWNYSCICEGWVGTKSPSYPPTHHTGSRYFLCVLLTRASNLILLFGGSSTSLINKSGI